MAKQRTKRDETGGGALSPQMRLDFAEEQRVRREDAADVRCRVCRKRFSVPRWYAEKGVRLHFCSSACREEWKGEKVDEPFRLRLKGRPEHRGGNWETQAARCRERDGFRCRVCGVTEEALRRQLDVHHLVPFRLFESAAEANRLSNLVAVCRPCHKRLEEHSDLPLFERVKHPGQDAGDEDGV